MARIMEAFIKFFQLHIVWLTWLDFILNCKLGIRGTFPQRGTFCFVRKCPDYRGSTVRINRWKLTQNKIFLHIKKKYLVRINRLVRITRSYVTVIKRLVIMSNFMLE